MQHEEALKHITVQLMHELEVERLRLEFKTALSAKQDVIDELKVALKIEQQQVLRLNEDLARQKDDSQLQLCRLIDLHASRLADEKQTELARINAYNEILIRKMCDAH